MRVEQSPWRTRYSTSPVRKRVFAGTRTAPMRAIANRRWTHSGELLSQRHTLSPGATPSAMSPFAASSTRRAISAKDWRTAPKTRASRPPHLAAARAGSSPTGVRPSQRPRQRAGKPPGGRAARSSPRVIRPPLPSSAATGLSRREQSQSAAPVVRAALRRSAAPARAYRRPPASASVFHPASRPRPSAAAGRSVRAGHFAIVAALRDSRRRSPECGKNRRK